MLLRMRYKVSGTDVGYALQAIANKFEVASLRQQREADIARLEVASSHALAPKCLVISPSTKTVISRYQ